jgi:hypothetical protein
MRTAFLAPLLIAVGAGVVGAARAADIAAPAGADALVIAEYDMLYARTLWDQSGRSTLKRHPHLGAGPWFSPLNADWHAGFVAEASGGGIDVLAVEWPVDADPETMAFARTGLLRLLAALDAAEQKGDTIARICPHLVSTHEGVSGAAVTKALCEFAALVPESVWARVRIGGAWRGRLLFPGAMAELAAAAGPVIRERYGRGLYVAGAEPQGPPVCEPYTDELEKDPGVPSWLYVRGWNNYQTGREGVYSCEAGYTRADAVRVAILKRRSSHPYAARFVNWYVPAAMARDSIALTSVTVRNTGSRAWRPSDAISLSYQWFRRGESLGWQGTDVMVGRVVRPGDEYSFKLGVATRRPGVESYYFALEEYELRMDLRLGGEAWFSEDGSTIPLSAPVAVAEIPRYEGAIVSTQVPPVMKTGGSYLAFAQVENAGSQPWTLIYGLSLAYHFVKVDDATGERERVVEGAGFVPMRRGGLAAGQVQDFEVFIRPNDRDGNPLPIPGPADNWHYEIDWDFFDGDKYVGAGGARDALTLVDRDVGAVLYDADLPAAVAAGSTIEAKVFLRDRGTETFSPAKHGLGYRWFYIDGRPAGEAQYGGPVGTELVPGSDYISASHAEAPEGGEAWISDAVERVPVTAPDRPGVYVLQWLFAEDGTANTDAAGLRVRETLCQSVYVAGGDLAFVDLSEQLNVDAVASGSGSRSEGFDGRGGAFDDELYPPDLENASTPVIAEGLYGAANGSQRMMFRFPPKAAGRHTAIAARGQKVDVPDGNYQELVLLGASIGGVQRGEVRLHYDRAEEPKEIVFPPWMGSEEPAGEVGLEVPGPDGPQRLYVCRVPVDPAIELKDVSLPRNENIRIVALTLRR